jgi:hypothetical protein
MYTLRHQDLGGGALATDCSRYAVPPAGSLGAQMVVKRVTKITFEPAQAHTELGEADEGRILGQNRRQIICITDSAPLTEFQ